jgi:hydroxymethylbilane synthase
VSQGILGIEARAGDDDILDFVMPLNHDATRLCAVAERAFLKGLGGGCRAPIAALAVVEGESLVLDGLAASEDGSEILRDREEGRMTDPEEVGRRLAERVLARGASRFLNPDKRASTWW